MTEILFDRKLLMRRRSRVAAAAASHDFLLQRAGEDIAARLDAVVRDFPVAINLGAYHGAIAPAVLQTGRVGRVVNTESCPALVAQCASPCIACDEELLPFKAGSVDLFISALSLHLVNDLPGALVQIRRALKPDGLLLAAILGGRTLRELREVLTTAESEMEGGASPRVIPFADVRDCGALLQRAGFALPVADADQFTVTYRTALDLMHDLRAMGAANMLSARSRKPLRRATLFRAAELYAERFPAPDGRVAASFEIIHLTGWAPDESQPIPLAPGSAKKRLADALDANEQTAGEKADPKGRR
ncbi:MAG: methyltransferase domain-containing protein [Hyphomicrobiales bacterium]|nr:methyltransferase domain-containing protein [Hyphomicrobiales bacterium]